MLLHAGRHLLAAAQLAVRVHLDHCVGETREPGRALPPRNTCNVGMRHRILSSASRSIALMPMLWHHSEVSPQVQCAHNWLGRRRRAKGVHATTGVPAANTKRGRLLSCAIAQIVSIFVFQEQLAKVYPNTTGQYNMISALFVGVLIILLVRPRLGSWAGSTALSRKTSSLH